MSVLHCGLYSRGRGAERPTAESDFEFVNRLVSRVEPLIQHRGGFVNEFRGDGFQAFFPAGAEQAAVRCASSFRKRAFPNLQK